MARILVQAKKNTDCIHCILIIIFLFLMAASLFLGAPLSAYSFDQTTAQLLAPPSAAHLMGTDELGRDMLSRIYYGSQLSISIGLTTALVAFVIGTIYGSIAGFCGGKVDNIMMRGVDVAYSLPDLLVMILVGVIVGRGTVGILIARGLVSWMGTARLVRAQFLQLQHEEFIEAARASCESNLANTQAPFTKFIGANYCGSDIYDTVCDSFGINSQFHRLRTIAPRLQLGHASK